MDCLGSPTTKRQRSVQAESVWASVGSREPEHDLGLKRVRVLELVDEQPAVFLLQRAAHGCVVAQELGGDDQQVVETERVTATTVFLRFLAGVVEQRDRQAIDVVAPGGDVRKDDALAEVGVELLRHERVLLSASGSG